MRALVLVLLALPALADEATQVQAVRALMKKQQFKQAGAAAEACVTSFPRSAQCHKLAGTAWARAGDFARARDHYQRFLQFADPTDPSADKVREILRAAGEVSPDEPASPPEATRPPDPNPSAEQARAAPTGARVVLLVGASATLAVSNLQRIAVENTSIADATVVDGGHFTLTGKTKGVTTVIAWSESQARTNWMVEVK